MNLEQLRTAGGFVSPEPTKAAITWKGNQFDIHVHHFSFGIWEKLQAGDFSKCTTLAACILLGDDKTPLTIEQAQSLDLSLASEFYNAVNVVNGGQKN